LQRTNGEAARDANAWPGFIGSFVGALVEQI
jgi:hypothetical protein